MLRQYRTCGRRLGSRDLFPELGPPAPEPPSLLLLSFRHFPDLLKYHLVAPYARVSTDCRISLHRAPHEHSPRSTLAAFSAVTLHYCGVTDDTTAVHLSTLLRCNRHCYDEFHDNTTAM
eukprot:2124418-Rhodomonas_salina.1